MHPIKNSNPVELRPQPHSRLNTVADSVLMIKPQSFCANPETLASNSFQIQGKLKKDEILKLAQIEFLNFQKVLQEHGIRILKFEESLTQQTPDALYPNNWFCHLPDGRVFVFPMFPKNRRDEVRNDVINSLQAVDVIDLRYLEKESLFLEGTGSLILDHKNKIGFACLSPRTSQAAVDIFSELSGYRIHTFDSVDLSGRPIYHTNVMMALSPEHTVVNLSSVKNAEQKKNLISTIEKTGRRVVDISYDEMNHFAGNMLFLKGFWVCSTKAYTNLSPEKYAQLATEGLFIHSDLHTIESYGGGGARCLLAEVFN